MSGIISGATRLVNFGCDICKAIDALANVAIAYNRNEDPLLATASLVNRLVLIGFATMNEGMLIVNTKSDILSKFKVLETIPRVINLPIQLLCSTEQSRHEASSLKAFIRVLEKGIAEPFSDILRVCAEEKSYYEQHFLDMTPEELAKARRPIINDEGIIIGYRPIDIEECKINLKEAQESVSSTTKTRTLTTWGIAETAVCGIAVPIYERLSRCLSPTTTNEQSVEEDNRTEAFLQLDFLQFPSIPYPLHNDAIFRQHICPITQEPIRDPVQDPTNNATLYERSAIINWLNLHSISPITRQALTIDQLQEMPGIKALIDNRLNHHKQGLLHYLEQQVNSTFINN